MRNRLFEVWKDTLLFLEKSNRSHDNESKNLPGLAHLLLRLLGGADQVASTRILTSYRWQQSITHQDPYYLRL